MRKPQSQPALALLTEADREQLAEWLRRDSYETVLARINQPRVAGGLGLDISKKPLQTFYAKVALLDLINTRLSSDKKMTLAEFEAVANAECLLASASSNPQSATAGQALTRTPQWDGSSASAPNTPQSNEVHDAILNTTHDLATSGDNTPTQLLALQRLADFPTRAAFRAQRMELDTQMRAHKIEMDLHRKHIANERLELSKRSLELREKQLAARAESHSAIRNGRSGSDPHSEMSDALGPYATTLDEIEERACRKFGLPLPSRNSRPPQCGNPCPSESSEVKDSVSSLPSFPSVQPSVVDPPSASFAISAVNYSRPSVPASASLNPQSALRTSFREANVSCGEQYRGGLGKPHPQFSVPPVQSNPRHPRHPR